MMANCQLNDSVTAIAAMPHQIGSRCKRQHCSSMFASEQSLTTPVETYQSNNIMFLGSMLAPPVVTCSAQHARRRSSQGATARHEQQLSTSNSCLTLAVSTSCAKPKRCVRHLQPNRPSLQMSRTSLNTVSISSTWLNQCHTRAILAS
jgi:hypothetical protein